MKKFKHKKTGDIAELVSNSGYKLNQSTVGLIPKEYIENSSDWEEIKENGHRFSPGDKVCRVWESGTKTLGVITDDNRFKALESYNNEGGVTNGDIYGLGDYEYELAKNYQILSFSYPNVWDSDLATLHDDGLYKLNKNPWGWDLNSLLNEGMSVKSGDIKIHSVKRLSDDEVFTIGDKVESTIANLGRPTELTDFKIINNKLKFGLRDLGYYPLSTIIKSKNPLFKTEDGVDIYEGDLVTSVNLDTLKIHATTPIRTGESLKYGNYKHFSTKEAAENYIIYDKPCLSFNDVWNISNNKSSDNHYVVIDKRQLKELVKSKL